IDSGKGLTMKSRAGVSSQLGETLNAHGGIVLSPPWERKNKGKVDGEEAPTEREASSGSRSPVGKDQENSGEAGEAVAGGKEVSPGQSSAVPARPLFKKFTRLRELAFRKRKGQGKPGATVEPADIPS